MLAQRVVAHVNDDAERALEQVLTAFASLGYPSSVVQQWSIPKAAAIDLVAGLRRDLARVDAPRILEVGTFVGTSALVMLLTLPRARVHSIDPNFALEVEFDAMHCAHRDADLSKTTQDVAARAAEILRVRDRLVLHEGGFSTAVTFAGTARNTRAVGADVIATHGPFDAAFIDGLHFEQTVLADLQLASRGVHHEGALYLHDVVGYWGSTVRRALSRFLTESPEFALTHEPYADLYRSVGRVSRAAVSADAVHERFIHCFGLHAPRVAEYIARALASTLPPFTAQSLDAFSAPVAAAIDARGASHSCGVLLGSLDECQPEDALHCLRTASAGRDALLIGCTPPGERGAAGRWSVPLAVRVAQLDALGFDAFDVIVPFLEPFTYALGDVCFLSRANSFLLNLVVAVRRSSALHAGACALGHHPLSEASARAIESARLQQIHDHAALRRTRAEEASVRALIRH